MFGRSDRGSYTPSLMFPLSAQQLRTPHEYPADREHYSALPHLCRARHQIAREIAAASKPLRQSKPLKTICAHPLILMFPRPRMVRCALFPIRLKRATVTIMLHPWLSWHVSGSLPACLDIPGSIMPECAVILCANSMLILGQVYFPESVGWSLTNGLTA